MIVSSADRIPQNSLSGVPPQVSRRYYRAQANVLQMVTRGVEAATTAPGPDSFQGFGPNFQFQVERYNRLVNSVGMETDREQIAKDASPTNDFANAPQVVPYNPIQINPVPTPEAKLAGPFQTPHWGNSPVGMERWCTPFDWTGVFRKYPWLIWALLGGGVLLATGGIVVHRRRRRRL